jgi:hypothetical protein
MFTQAEEGAVASAAATSAAAAATKVLVRPTPMA